MLISVHILFGEIIFNPSSAGPYRNLKQGLVKVVFPGGIFYRSFALPRIQYRFKYLTVVTLLVTRQG